MSTSRGPGRLRWVQSATLGVLLLSVGAARFAQHGMVDGIVTDANLVPLPGATISVLGSTLHVVTGENGRFRIVRLVAGRYLVAVHRPGYAPESAVLDIVADDTLRPAFTMQPVASALDTMIITARAMSWRLQQFEDRRRMGIGHFLTRSDIERRYAVATSDLLLAIPGVKIIANVAISEREYPARTCPLAFFIDGNPARGRALSQMPPPADIAGIEVYSGSATIPLQYKTAGTGCGIVLIWTRDGSG